MSLTEIENYFQRFTWEFKSEIERMEEELQTALKLLEHLKTFVESEDAKRRIDEIGINAAIYRS